MPLEDISTPIYLPPTPPTSDQTSHTERKQGLEQPKTQAEFEDQQKKAWRLKTELENFKTKSSSLEEENKKLKKMLEMVTKVNSASKLNHEQDMQMLKKKLEKDSVLIYKKEIGIYKKREEENKFRTEQLTHVVRDKEKELADLTMKYNRLEKSLEICDATKISYKREIDLIKKREEEGLVMTEQLTRALQDKECELTELTLKYKRIHDMLNNYEESIKSSAELEHQIREHQTKCNKMRKIIEKYKELYEGSVQKNLKMEDQLCALRRRIDNLANFEESHRTCLEIRVEKDREIDSLLCELSEYEKNYEKLHKEYDELNVRLKENRRKQSEETTKLKIVEKEVNHLQKAKENAVNERQNADDKLQHLSRVLEEKENRLGSLTEQLLRLQDMENKVNQLQKEKENAVTERQNANDKLQHLSRVLEEKENKLCSLTEQLLRNDDLFEQYSTLQKENANLLKVKKNAENQINELTRTSQALERKVESLTKELTSYSNKNDDLLSTHGEEIGFLEKDKKNADSEISKLANALHEKEKKIESLTKELAKTKDNVAMLSSEVMHIQESTERTISKKEKGFQKENAYLQSVYNRAITNIEDLSKECEDMKVNNKKSEHNITELTRVLRDKDQEITSLSAQLTRFEGIVLELKDQKRDGQNTEQKINKLSKAVRDKEDEIESLIDQLSKSEDKVAALSEEIRNNKQASGGSMQQLQEENTSLRSVLVEKTMEAEARISDLSKEIIKLQKSAKYHSGEHQTQKPYDDSALLEAKLADVTRRFEELRRDYDVVKREKDLALKRLCEVAGVKQKDDNSDIAELSDENRPITLGEKFSQLYDDQWTDAIENLEEMKYTETDGIRYLIGILKRVFDECVRVSEDYFRQLQELTGTTNLPRDHLKKLKDLRKATAMHSVNSVKPIVNTVMSNVFKNEKAACQTYIDRSIELCWLMCVQDPPVVIDFTAVRGTDIDDQKFRKFSKTGSKIDFMVWPVIRLHINGPLLQKGVVQPL